VQASRDLVARLQSELGAKLTAAIGAGGPARAIDVCAMWKRLGLSGRRRSLPDDRNHDGKDQQRNSYDGQHERQAAQTIPLVLGFG
jgi:hypothetical protein